MTEPVEPLRILVADDHAAFRDGLTALLPTVDDIAVVGQAGRVRRSSPELRSSSPTSC